MDKQKLKQLRDIRYEIQTLTKLLHKKKETLHDVVTGSSAEFPYTKHVMHIEGIDYDKEKDNRERICLKLKNRIEIAEQLEYDILKWIDSIEDSKTRTIFTLRYIDNKTWTQISNILGKYYGDYARITHDRYFEKERKEKGI